MVLPFVVATIPGYSARIPVPAIGFLTCADIRRGHDDNAPDIRSARFQCHQNAVANR
jgi:hypothetical protein